MHIHCKKQSISRQADLVCAVAVGLHTSHNHKTKTDD